MSAQAFLIRRLRRRDNYEPSGKYRGLWGRDAKQLRRVKLTVRWRRMRLTLRLGEIK